jgi:hypothetical protein
VIDVLIDRHSTSFIEVLTSCGVGASPRLAEELGVLLDAVEDDHRVVQRVPEDGQQRDDRVGADVEVEDGVQPDVM